MFIYHTEYLCPHFPTQKVPNSKAHLIGFMGFILSLPELFFGTKQKRKRKKGDGGKCALTTPQKGLDNTYR